MSFFLNNNALDNDLLELLELFKKTEHKVEVTIEAITITPEYLKSESIDQYRAEKLKQLTDELFRIKQILIKNNANVEALLKDNKIKCKQNNTQIAD